MNIYVITYGETTQFFLSSSVHGAINTWAHTNDLFDVEPDQIIKLADSDEVFIDGSYLEENYEEESCNKDSEECCSIKDKDCSSLGDKW